MADGDYRRLQAACGWCAVLFEHVRPAGKRGRNPGFCSPACKAASAERMKTAVPCQTCGAMFRPRRRASKAQLVCSLGCRRRPSARVYESPAERSSEAGHRRRARKRGAGYERFMRREVFERDGWLCMLCRTPVDRTGADKWLRPSLDHITPLARGGQHTRANTQCAHWICNSRKAHQMLRALPAPAARET